MGRGPSETDFLFLREFTYAAMFRFNSSDEFNVPYGGVTYNRKSLKAKPNSLARRNAATAAQHDVAGEDFEPFLERRAGRSDFLFIDPPYDTDFSDYDKMPFGAVTRCGYDAPRGPLSGHGCDQGHAGVSAVSTPPTAGGWQRREDLHVDDQIPQ